MGAGQHRELDSGALFIATRTRNFQAGETVQGTVHLSLDQSVAVRTLFLELKGVADGAWNPRGGFEALKRMETVTDKIYVESQVANQRFPIYSFTEECTKPGQLSFPFSFVLPSNLPGSFYLGYGNVIARIRYSLEASLEGRNVNVQTNSLMIHIKQHFEEQIYSITDDFNAQVSTRCCSSLGVVHMKVEFERNSLVPGEAVVLRIHVDNQHCRTAVIGFSLLLYRSLRLKNAADELIYFNKSVARSVVLMHRIPPGAALLGDQSVQMSLLLDKEISTAVSVRCQCVECAYSVGLRLLMEEGLCGIETLPESQHSIRVYPVQLPQLQPDWIPELWQPVEMPLVQFTNDRNEAIGSAPHTEIEH